MGYKHREADPALVKTALEEPNFLLKVIPHVDGSPRISANLSNTALRKSP